LGTICETRIPVWIIFWFHYKYGIFSINIMKLPVISGKDLIKILYKNFGFRPIRQRGDHVTITNDKAFVTVPLHNELDTGTLKSILDDCGISREEFIKYYKK